LVLYRSGLARSLKTFLYQYFFQSNLNSILDQVLHQEFSRSIDQNWSGLTIINDILNLFSINALFVLWNKLFHIYLSLEKLVNKKLFLVKEKFSLVFIKVFFFYFGCNILSRNYKKSKNILLFVDYIKFGYQSFDYYIFCFESLFIYFIFNFIFYNLI
jgi:hypothetical protein